MWWSETWRRRCSDAAASSATALRSCIRLISYTVARGDGPTIRYAEKKITLLTAGDSRKRFRPSVRTSARHL
eukprot:2236603-Prymnesium_polylepis.1